MKWLLYSYARGEYLSWLSVEMLRGATVLNNRYTKRKYNALYFLTANEAVYLASLIACYLEEELTVIEEREEP